jgi:hypothetical protein
VTLSLLALGFLFPSVPHTPANQIKSIRSVDGQIMMTGITDRRRPDYDYDRQYRTAAAPSTMTIDRSIVRDEQCAWMGCPTLV